MKKTLCLLLLAGSIFGLSFVSADKPIVKAKETISVPDLKELAVLYPNEEETINDYATNRFELFSAAGFTDEDIRQESLSSKSSFKEIKVDKDYIYDRMLNTVDYFDSVEGQYNRMISSLNSEYSVSYGINKKEKPQSFEKITGSNNRISFYDGKALYTEISHEGNKSKGASKNIDVDVYDYQELINLDVISLVKSTSRIQTHEDGNPVYNYRHDTTFTTIARESLFPQEMTFGFLSDFSTWEISGFENISGRECTKINGTLSGNYGAKLNTAKFSFWVDTETGILLKALSYNKSGKLVESLETLKISVDKPLNKSAFAETESYMMEQAKQNNINVNLYK